MPPGPAVARREREQELVRATRALFDERGMQEAPVEEIAKAVGIARGLIYRQFASKEELYVLTVTDYLAELDGVLGDAVDPGAEPAAQLELWARAYAGFCLAYPAFLDCALSLMRRPAAELRDVLSDSVWLRLGQGIAALRRPRLADPARVAASRIRTTSPTCCGRRSSARRTSRASAWASARRRPASPSCSRSQPEQVVETCVRSALATVGASS